LRAAVELWYEEERKETQHHILVSLHESKRRPTARDLCSSRGWSGSPGRGQGLSIPVDERSTRLRRDRTSKRQGGDKGEVETGGARGHRCGTPRNTTKRHANGSWRQRRASFVST